MNLILHTIRQEKHRIEYMLLKYQNELSSLPRGTVSEKRVGEKTYYYLKYRDGKKVISQYVGKKEIERVRTLVEKRRHIEAIMKSLQEEKAIADKALEGMVSQIHWDSPTGGIVMEAEKFSAVMGILVEQVVHLITENYGYDEVAASNEFYSSKVYALLEQEETKLWHFSPLTLLNLFDEEKKTGSFELPEET